MAQEIHEKKEAVEIVSSPERKLGAIETFYDSIDFNSLVLLAGLSFIILTSGDKMLKHHNCDNKRYSDIQFLKE